MGGGMEVTTPEAVLRRYMDGGEHEQWSCGHDEAESGDANGHGPGQHSEGSRRRLMPRDWNLC